MYTYNNKHSLRSNTEGYGGETHWTGSQDSVRTVPSGRELYQLHFSLQAASPETSGYTLVSWWQDETATSSCNCNVDTRRQVVRL